MGFFIFSDGLLNTGRYEEILLFQSKFFATVMVIVWIKHVNNVFRQILLLYRLKIIAFIKGCQVKFLNRLCIPDSQYIDHIIAVTDNRNIVWYGIDCLISVMDKTVSLTFRIPLNPDITAEFNRLSIFRTLNLKWISVFQPVIRHFHLISVMNFLLEHAVFITDTTAVHRIVQCG